MLLRVQSRVNVNFQALCEAVIELDVRLEDVCRRPRLGKRQPVLGISVLGLQVAFDATLGSVALAHDAEADGRGRACLHLKVGAVVGIVLGQQVIRRLADILRRRVSTSPVLMDAHDGDDHDYDHDGPSKLGE